MATPDGSTQNPHFTKLNTLSVISTLLFAATVLIALPDRAHAQEEPPTALQPGSWALQFGVGENFTLGSYLGSMLSAKRHIAQGRAVQLGLSLSARNEEKDEEHNETIITETDWAVAVTAHYVAYPLLDDVGAEGSQLYVGLGPQVNYSHREADFDREEALANRSTTWGVGLSGLVGAEWFVRERISLSAAYRAELMYSHVDAESEFGEADPVGPVSSRWGFGPAGVLFGVSAYF